MRRYGGGCGIVKITGAYLGLNGLRLAVDMEEYQEDVRGLEEIGQDAANRRGGH